MPSLDADSVLDDAESALTDREARNRILNSTKDQVLGFLLDHIPNMRIPDIQGIDCCHLSFLSVRVGVKDDVQFAVTRLDLSGFKLRKEDVTVSLGSSLNEEFVTCEARNISAAFNGVKWKYCVSIFISWSTPDINNCTFLISPALESLMQQHKTLLLKLVSLSGHDSDSFSWRLQTCSSTSGYSCRSCRFIRHQILPTCL